MHGIVWWFTNDTRIWRAAHDMNHVASQNSRGTTRGSSRACIAGHRLLRHHLTKERTPLSNTPILSADARHCRYIKKMRIIHDISFHGIYALPGWIHYLHQHFQRGVWPHRARCRPQHQFCVDNLRGIGAYLREDQSDAGDHCKEYHDLDPQGKRAKPAAETRP